MAKVKELFEVYAQGEFPLNGGYIVSAFFDDKTMYSKYEIISYSNVKDIYSSDEGIVFQADGQKVFVLVEPANYPSKHIEPAYRSEFHGIPYRFKEVDVITTTRQDRIMIGKEPVMTYTNFTVMKSQGQNYSYLFYLSDDILGAMGDYFMKTLWKESGVPRADSQKSSRAVLQVFQKILIPSD